MKKINTYSEHFTDIEAVSEFIEELNSDEKVTNMTVTKAGDGYWVEWNEV